MNDNTIGIDTTIDKNNSSTQVLVNKDTNSNTQVKKYASQVDLFQGVLEEHNSESTKSTVGNEEMILEKTLSVRGRKEGRPKKQHLCSLCGTTFRNIQGITLHKATRSKLSCPDCSATFCFKSRLDDHKKTHLQNYKCTICKKCFLLETKLNLHMRRNHNGSTKRRYTCSVCGINFSTKSDLQVHESSHKAEKIALSCSVCGKGFRSSSELFRHELNHVTEPLPLPFPCSFCTESFETLSGLQIHRSKRHKQQVPFTCSGCNGTFETLTRLQEHYEECENDRLNTDKMFLCSSCKESFQSEESLQNHIRTHYVFPCFTCYKSFSTSQDLELHEKYHVGYFLSCPDCTKCFYTKLDLKLHVKVHAMDLYCSNCGETFTDESDLKLHYGLNRSTTCCRCGASFTSAYHLELHKRIHTSLQSSFPCSVCAICFSEKKDLDQHAITAHDTIVCPVCAIHFSSKLDLELHERQHGTAETFLCWICLKNFPTMLDLECHKKRHSQGEHIVCTACSESFPTKLDLELHNRFRCSEISIPDQEMCSMDQLDQSNISCNDTDSNTEGQSGLSNTHFYTYTTVNERNEHLSKCRFCQYWGTLTNLSVHMKDIHNEQMHLVYSCSTCSKQFPHKCALVCHETIHEYVKVACPVCSRWFMCKKSLKVHLRTVHEENVQDVLFTCSACSKQFSDYSAFCSHQLIHSYDECPICSKQFESKDDMDKHLRNFHNTENEQSKRNDHAQ